MQVRIEDLRKHYGRSLAVGGVSLTIRDGELFTLLGPSGCGKTTTLRAVMGLEMPDGGRILLGDQDVTRWPPHRRPCGMVFQNYALYPHMSVFDNVAYGLKVRVFNRGSFWDKLLVLTGRLGGVGRRPEVRRPVLEALAMVELAGLEQRAVSQLSGGQQQRVALARALVTRPDVLLLDEPLGALDAKLRVRVREEIRTIQRRLGITTLYVTHDQEEAMAISDRIAVMHQGKVLQVGTPEEIYRQPVNIFVADFLGLANLLPGPAGQRLLIRPEAIRLGDGPGARDGVVLDRQFYGSVARLRVQSGELTFTIDVADPAFQSLPAAGETVRFCLPPDRIQVLPS